MDEPCLGLAPKVGNEVYAVLHAPAPEGQSLIVVEESSRRALDFVDRACVMKLGEQGARRPGRGAAEDEESCSRRTSGSATRRGRGAVTELIQHVIDALSVGSTYALLALGLTLVFSVMNLINFAYGILLVWGGLRRDRTRWARSTSRSRSSCRSASPSSPLLSMAMGRFAFRPFIGAPPITLLITSFGVLLIVQYVAILVFGEQPRVLEVPELLQRRADDRQRPDPGAAR